MKYINLKKILLGIIMAACFFLVGCSEKTIVMWITNPKVLRMEAQLWIWKTASSETLSGAVRAEFIHYEGHPVKIDNGSVSVNGIEMGMSAYSGDGIVLDYEGYYCAPGYPYFNTDLVHTIVVTLSDGSQYEAVFQNEIHDVLYTMTAPTTLTRGQDLQITWQAANTNFEMQLVLRKNVVLTEDNTSTIRTEVFPIANPQNGVFTIAASYLTEEDATVNSVKISGASIDYGDEVLHFANGSYFRRRVHVSLPAIEMVD